MSGAFSKCLIQAREQKGFKSALKFHEFLHRSGGIDVNYAQYKKIESGLVVARPEFVSRIGRALPQYAEQFVRTYCLDIFPDQSHLFATNNATPLPSPALESPLLHAQDELNLKQIALIVSSPVHYELYLIMALARQSIPFEDLKKSLPHLNAKILKEFKTAKLLYQDQEERYSSRSFEWSFPAASSEFLKQAYRKMSEWDLHFHEKHDFNSVYTRVLLRRVSLRYLPLLKRQAESLADLLRASDEVDVSKNTNVISLVLQLREGKLPGRLAAGRATVNASFFLAIKNCKRPAL